MSVPPGLARSERWYARLLRLYPPVFRERFGADALELFRDRYLHEWGARGRGGVTRLWVRTLANVLVHGPLERLAALGSRGPGRGVDLLRPTLRSLVRAPGLRTVIVLTLGVGIASNVALYSVVRGVLLRPLPFSQPERLVRIQESHATLDEGLQGVSPLNFADWDRGVAGVASMTAWYLTTGTFRTEAAVEEIRSAQVTADFFEVFDAAPALGGTFRREEVLRYGPLVLGYGLWQRLFAGDPGVVGKTVSVSGAEYRVIGVMGPEFSFPDPSVEAWLAWDMAQVYEGRPEVRTWRFLQAAARLEPATSLEVARASLKAEAGALAAAHPVENEGWTVELAPLHADLVAGVRGTLWVAFGAVGFLLLVACANVANLLLARVPERSRELAIRTSLGASRRDLISDLLAESVLLAVLGGLLGLGLGALLLELLLSLDAGKIPRIEEVGIDGGVVVFATLVSLATSVFFGLAPAAQALRESTMASLRDGGRTSGSVTSRRLRQGFVAAQVAVALVLLTGAALFRASLAAVTGVDPGFDPAHAATFRVSLDSGPEGPPGTVRYYRALMADVAALPGVVAVGAAQTLPMDPVAGDFERPYRPLGATTVSADAPAAAMRIVTQGFVEAMGMRLLEGTGFDGSETPEGPRVAMVNRALAGRLWPGGSGVGRSFELAWQGGWHPYTVVGVVEDVRHQGPRVPVGAQVYTPHGWIPYLAMSVVVRTAGDPALVVPALRAAVRSQERLQPAYNFVTLEALSRGAVAEERFLAVLLQVFSAIALLLASAGVYGVIAYSVSRRRREIGLRMALGARPWEVARDVLVGAVVMTGLGAVVGLALVRLVAAPVDALLFGVTTTDLRATATGVGVVIGVAVLAAYLPARRASRIPPATALASD